LREFFGPLEEFVDEFVALYVYRKYRDPFAVTVATILSQNTTEKNAFRAWRALERYGVTPESVLALGEKLKEIIRPAGLQEQKARAIAEVARSWERLERAVRAGDREELLKVKGVGKKTADVVLMLFGHKAFPVDTHVFRVARRLGWASGNYDAVSAKLSELFEGREAEGHMYLILLGRRICKAKKPECGKCPLADTCPKRVP